jgi:hypothetical protein
MLLKSPQEIRPTIDEQKALLLIRFPADFSRNLDTNQPAPLQLLLDGRNSNSAQIAANSPADRQKLSAGAAGRESEAEQQRADRAQLV